MLIKKLTGANGLPSFEGEVRNLIKEELAGQVDRIFTDRLGNLIAVKNETAQGPHIALSAHMDEVGVCVTGIDKSGYLKFASWGVDPRLLVAKVVRIGKNRIPGVIGSKPIHLQKPEERNVAIGIDNLYIDIGASTKEEAEKHVSLGDFAAFDSDFREFGDHKVKAKALDDRAGCAAIVEMLRSDYKGKLTGVFCVQEEVGCRGSAVAANRVYADLVINLEGTVCADTAGVPEHQHVTSVGKGPAISLKDGGSIYLRKYIDKLTACADKNGIPWQFRRTSAGGTDSMNYHVAHGGTPVIGLAVPCRYLHSPISVMDVRDFENLVLLLKTFIPSYYEEASR